MAATSIGDAKKAFPHALYADGRTDWDIVNKFGLEVCDCRISQCKILVSTVMPEDKGAIFYYICSKLPYSIVLTHLGVEMTVMELLDSYGYDWIPFKYKNTFIVRIHDIKESPSFLSKMVQEAKVCRKTVYLKVQVMLGGSNRLKIGESEPFYEGLIYPWGVNDYVIRVVDFTLDTYPLDDVVRLQIYVKLFADSWVSPEFRNLAYYHNPSYAMWSLHNHQSQWKSILEKLPGDAVLVAPGDGVGVISSMWQGKAVCGDAVVLSSTHQRVVKESVSETIMRSRSEEKRIFILSYIYDFVSEVDWIAIAQAECPVIIMDFRDHVRDDLGAVSVIGKGIVGYRIEGLVSFVRESRDYVPKMLYSENLLNLNKVLLMTPSYPADYLLSIAPNKSYYAMTDAMVDYIFQRGGNVEKYTGQMVTPLVNSIDELIPILHLSPYFAPIGKVVTAFVHVDVSLLTKFKTRTVYTTALSESNLKRLENLPHLVNGFLIFFFCTDSKFQEFSFNFTDSKGAYKGKLVFCDVDYGKLRVEEDPIRLFVQGEMYNLGDPPLTAQQIASVVPYEVVSSEILGMLSRFMSLVDIKRLGEAVTSVRWNDASKGLFPVSESEMLKVICAIVASAKKKKAEKVQLSVVMQQGWDPGLFKRVIQKGVGEKRWQPISGKYLKW